MLDQNNSLLTIAVRGTRTTDTLKAAVVSEQVKLTRPQESSSVQEGRGQPGCRATFHHPSPAAVGPRSGMGNIRPHCWWAFTQAETAGHFEHALYLCTGVY